MKHISFSRNLYKVASNDATYYASFQGNEMHSNVEFRPMGDTLVFLKESEISDKQAFVKLAEKINPLYIIDLRSVQRLDVIAGSRPKAFKLFDNFKIKYLDFYGRSNYKSDDCISIENALISYLENLLPDRCEHVRPFVIFFDDETLLQTMKQNLPERLHKSKKCINYFKIAEYKSGFLSIHPSIA
ncbi:hypothetical protein [Pseudomonas inefficax]|uniref:hypothetical protein n=1 Tax=Pseudomonas inefficax TaxID=2078786 RepID=UPI0035C5A4D5